MKKDADKKKLEQGEPGGGGGRRSTVKKIVLGTGIVTTSQLSGLSWATRWARPVIDSVVLPGHAQTSSSDVGGY
ncbi:MAG: hypothetical protein WB783_01010 [Arenicellales bacterium]